MPVRLPRRCCRQRQHAAAAAAVVCLLSLPAPLRSQELSPGTVVEKVLCRSDPGQSYALYLPSAYSPGKKWPIVYALDAGARGILPVTRFKPAAEELGYLLVGSNNSRNGPIRAIESAVQSMLSDTQSRFSIDPERVYFAGFSGGARVAVALASTLPWRVAGVIACGAGFPRTIEPSASTRFAFFGAVGMEDFNVPELRQLDGRLERLKVPHRLELFAGEHEWPPEAVCSNALEWMVLQAIRSGVRQPDSGFVRTLFDRMCGDAGAHGAAGRFYEEYLAWSAVARDFAGLEDLAAVSRRRAELADSRDFQAAVERLSRIEEVQKRAEDNFHRLVDSANMAPSDEPFAGQKLLTFVRNLVKDSRDGRAERLVAARRMVAFCWVELNETVASDLEAKDYRRAVERLQALAEIQPANQRIHFHLARAHALGGDSKKALQELGRAVDSGFADVELLVSSPDFETVRRERDFGEIVRRLRK